MYDAEKDIVDSIKRIDEAISTLKVCRYCWANQVENDGEVISDYDAITQAMRCLEEYKDSEERSIASFNK